MMDPSKRINRVIVKDIGGRLWFFADGPGAAETWAFADQQSPATWSAYPFLEDAAYQKFRAKLLRAASQS